MIELRLRQQQMVDKAIAALKEQGNTLCVAPTGAGKTIMLSFIVKAFLSKGKRCLILQHTDEILEQNYLKFQQVVPDVACSIINGKQKDFSGQVIFAMVQSLSKSTSLKKLPDLHMLVIDEAHHSVAPTYKQIITKTKSQKKPPLLLGMTATPTREDEKTLSELFTNIADQIAIEELVASGHLLYPKTFVIQSEAQEKIRELIDLGVSAESHEERLDACMSVVDLGAAVQHWKKQAADRKTIVFCSRVDHSLDVQQAFTQAGIIADHIDGGYSRADRARVLNDFMYGDTQVLSNANVLTEGWDFPPTSCIMILRGLATHTALIQMIGRGLRPLDPKVYPHLEKSDCIVLDFGLSILKHGSIEAKVDLLPKHKCPKCKQKIPKVALKCPLCGYDFEAAKRKREEKERVRHEREIQKIKEFEMRQFEMERRRLLTKEELSHEVKQQRETKTIEDSAEWERQQYKKKIRGYLERGQDHEIETILWTRVEQGRYVAAGDKTFCMIEIVSDTTSHLTVRNTELWHFLGTVQECITIGSQVLREKGGNYVPYEHQFEIIRPPTEAQMHFLKQYDCFPETRRQASALVAYYVFLNQSAREREMQERKDAPPSSGEPAHPLHSHP
jgi:superfamily II DNA or RNA helicase